MPKRFPGGLKRDVVAVARRRTVPLEEVAAEIVHLRRETRRLEMENEILRRAAAYFAREHLPKK